MVYIFIYITWKKAAGVLCKFSATQVHIMRPFLKKKQVKKQQQK